MNEAHGNLWSFKGTKAITTNGFVKRNGSCVMGRGCAHEAAIKWPKLAYELGQLIIQHGNRVFYLAKYDLLTFPVKHNWWEMADLNLIKQSATEALAKATLHDLHIYLPRPGCGNGRLKWSIVKPILEPILDSRFTVVTFA